MTHKKQVGIHRFVCAAPSLACIALLCVCLFLLEQAHPGRAATGQDGKIELRLFEGLTAGSLPNQGVGWSRTEKDHDGGDAQPHWWMRMVTPAGKPAYLEIMQEVWDNGCNLSATRDLELPGTVKAWTLSGRLQFIDAAENSAYLRVLDGDGKAIASFDRLTINHTQGENNPGDSYLTINSRPILPAAHGKAQWTSIMKFTTGAWKPFKLTVPGPKPGMLRLEYGGHIIDAPLPDGIRWDAPASFHVFFGWGIGGQGNGGMRLEGMTFSAVKTPN